LYSYYLFHIKLLLYIKREILFNGYIVYVLHTYSLFLFVTLNVHIFNSQSIIERAANHKVIILLYVSDTTLSNNMLWYYIIAIVTRYGTWLLYVCLIILKYMIIIINLIVPRYVVCFKWILHRNIIGILFSLLLHYIFIFCVFVLFCLQFNMCC